MLKDTMTDIFEWIVELYPFVQSKRPTSYSDDTVILELSGDGIRGRTSNGEDILYKNHEIKKYICSIGSREKLIVRFLPEIFLKRPLSSHRLPFHRALDMALLDVEEKMPFLRSKAQVVFAKSEKDGTGTDYFLLKRSLIAEIFNAIAESDATLSLVQMVRADGGCDVLTNASLRSLLPETRKARLKKRALAVIVALLFAAITATFVHQYIRLVSAEDRLDAEILVKRNQALSLRKQVGTYEENLRLLEAARSAKFSSISTGNVWDELTRLLPDTTWLTELVIHDNILQIAGFSESSAELIGIIGSSKLFSQPKFTAPVIRAPGQKGERFSMQIEIRSHD